MSSHREAPGISKDPVADNTDLYAFVSPDQPGTVTLIANWIPLEGPDGGPNFFEFGDDVLYEIQVDNDADAEPDVTFQFRFTTMVVDPNTFLYNTGPITSLDSSTWNRRQLYSVTRVTDAGNTVLGTGLSCPPCNIGPRSTPDYAALAQAAVHSLGDGIQVFAGQRREGFYVDLGAVFDLADLRPFQNLHVIPTPAAPGVDATSSVNVHSIAIQVPKQLLCRDGSMPGDPTSPASTIGVWASASRRMASVLSSDSPAEQTGPWVQVSRLGNPLINEAVIPMGRKDLWNSLPPSADAQFLSYVQHPELAGLLPVLYPGVFPHLAGLTAPRADLVAILMTGIPAGIVPGFQNFTGSRIADMLRLNMAVPPAASPNPLGLIGGDAAGFPNGRRVADDVFTIELRAIAGVTYPLVSPSYVPDAAASLVTDGLTPGAGRYIAQFPYLGVPLDGFDVPG
ncbi:MAG TPA: DUF4331 domain-containing protein [Candidatus Binatia bacterium]|nr:DUF4331 domain-containing protein [Candidatus Binatia bacterium]